MKDSNVIQFNFGTDKKTMSSIEIAQLTNKRHSDVLRDIREQLYTGLYGYKFDNPYLVYT